jgi:hypothetical protein
LAEFFAISKPMRMTAQPLDKEDDISSQKGQDWKRSTFRCENVY